jgi:O-antigen/teichoic acid export membrane protein
MEMHRKFVVVRAAMWTCWAYGAIQSIRLGSNLLLAKWLAPEVFGALAIANAVQIGLQMVSDMGIGPTIIRHQRGTENRFLDTLWTIQILRGFLVAVSAIALSFPLSKIYAIPVASTSLHTLPREQRLGRLNLLEVGIQIVAYAVMLFTAWSTLDILSLAVGGIIHGFLRASLSHLVLPGCRHRLAWDSELIWELLRFGRWIAVSSLVTFLAAQSDRLALGLVAPLSQVGVYTIASGLALLPREVAGKLADSVILPYIARNLRSDPDGLSDALESIRAFFMPVSLLLSAALAILAPVFFEFFYDDRYAFAAEIAPFIVLYGWISSAQIPLQRALLALGDSRSVALSGLARWLVGLAASLIIHRVYGLSGFVVGLCLGAVAGGGVLYAAGRRKDLDLWRQDLGYALSLLGIIAVSLAFRSSSPQVLWSSLVFVPSLVVPLALLVLTAIWATTRLARLVR